ncbi:permease-like cell division protein FtsX [Kangiella sp. HZ709]|uniref:permease-like cell division protein FtsX n=1 Tax=Kangiella sp. HZ709 TaxID=2666328 RepID=UPI0012B0E55B|nr:permease-like cell division protein FtsX [Kangiella sp. HZ709]MRX27853.1 cell division protein FtsX [Kangiella sp. HZ709]
MAGATAHKVSFLDRFKMALFLHKKNSTDSLLSILKQPTNSLLTIMVLAIALALPGIFYIMTNNAKALSSNWESTMAISLYLEESAGQQQAQELVGQLLAQDKFQSVSLTSKEQALEEFKKYSGIGDSLEMLTENPLPMVINVVPDEAKVALSELQPLVESLEKNPIVDSSSLDAEWINRYQEILKISEKIGSFISLLLAIGVLLIVGNTIRLAILNRREEIQVIKLVGATDAFIRRPFLYTGLWYGLMAGVIAALMISILSNLVASSTGRLAELYQSQYQLLGLSLSQTFTLVGIGALLGLFGSWISVRKHLKEIQPT